MNWRQVIKVKCNQALLQRARMKRRKRAIKNESMYVCRPSESVPCEIIIFIPIFCPFSAFLCQSKNLICYKGRLEMMKWIWITYFPALLHLILHETIVHYYPMNHQHQLDQVLQNVELDPRPQGDDFEKPCQIILAVVICLCGLVTFVNISEIPFAWSSLKLKSI